ALRMMTTNLVQTLAPGIGYFDLNFLGFSDVIATAVLRGPEGVALIDPGPSSTLGRLRAALASAGAGLSDVRTILLTHIHLDHAGATGTLVREHPAIEVYVHERGAPHLSSPERLLSSASRLYGADMDRLWGRFEPVPAANLHALAGGETIRVAGRTLEVAYTPGHASHHVSYLDRETRMAFVGDTAGIRRPDGFLVPPTPPPDIELDVWRASVARLRSWHPSALFVTHFGPSESADAHFEEFLLRLDQAAELARRSLERDESDDERSKWFEEQMRRELLRVVPNADLASYEAAGRLDLSWRGLARYWRKAAERASAPSA
ncbi:MAG TPA: MBL fold metallo-hydrolase, partial [Vicinamibacterales bacterium]|nr:MBL fold metallo-hydrolase [Vicinamibacterales bacterium]